MAKIATANTINGLSISIVALTPSKEALRRLPHGAPPAATAAAAWERGARQETP
jgi:hypothetical protein